MAYADPALAIAAIELAISDMTGKDVAVAVQLTRIDQAITLAGQAACTWQGRSWWWLKKKKTFTTAYQAITKVARATNVATITSAAHGLVVGCRVNISGVTLDDFDTVDAAVVATATTTTFTYANVGSNVTEVADATGTIAAMGYPLRTINTAAMTDLYAPTRVWIADDYPLAHWSAEEHESWVVMDWGTGQPLAYALSGDGLMLLSPIPDAEYLITVEYIKKHAKFVSASSAVTDLIVPDEFQWDVYVHGAAWLIRHDTTDVGSLADCPAFARAMKRMAEADPSMHYDERSSFGIPANRKAGLGWIGGEASTS